MNCQRAQQFQKKTMFVEKEGYRQIVSVSVRTTHCYTDQGPDPAAVSGKEVVHDTHSCPQATAKTISNH